MWDKVQIWAIFCTWEKKRLRRFWKSCRRACIPDENVTIVKGVCVTDTCSQLKKMNGKILEGCEHHFTNSGHLGCALSHLKVWNDVKNADRPFALVVESDVTFPDDFISDFQAAMFHIPNDFDLVWLYRYATSRVEDVYINPYAVIPGPTSSTACYLLTKEAAASLSDSNYLSQMCCITTFLTFSWRENLGSMRTARDMISGQTMKKPMVCNLKVYAPVPVMDVTDAFIVDDSSTDNV